MQSEEIEESKKPLSKETVTNQDRYIIHVDMDAYYAQVEMKRHGITEDQPLAVLQWRTLIAVNYPAKHAGVRRQMTAYEALAACPNCLFAHVAHFCSRTFFSGFSRFTRAFDFFHCAEYQCGKNTVS